MRQLGKGVAEFNYKIHINCDVVKLIESDALILFELLDFNTSLLFEKDQSMLSRDNFFRIAWGYLRVKGLASNHIGYFKI